MWKHRPRVDKTTKYFVAKFQGVSLVNGGTAFQQSIRPGCPPNKWSDAWLLCGRSIVVWRLLIHLYSFTSFHCICTRQLVAPSGRLLITLSYHHVSHVPSARPHDRRGRFHHETLMPYWTFFLKKTYARIHLLFTGRLSLLRATLLLNFCIKLELQMHADDVQVCLAESSVCFSFKFL